MMTQRLQDAPNLWFYLAPALLSAPQGGASMLCCYTELLHCAGALPVASKHQDRAHLVSFKAVVFAIPTEVRKVAGN